GKSARGLVVHLDTRWLRRVRRPRRQRDVEGEVGRVHVGEWLREREAFDRGLFGRVRLMGDDAAVTGAAAVGGDPEVGAGGAPAGTAAAVERVAPAEPRDGHGLWGA